MSIQFDRHSPKHGCSYPMIMIDGTIQELYYIRESLYNGVYLDKFGLDVTHLVECYYIYQRRGCI